MAIIEAGNAFSQNVTPLETWNRGIQLTADGFPKAKAGGVTFDWSTVTALANDTYLQDSLDDVGNPLPDAVPIKKGEKVLRYGTPIQRRASDGAFVLALTGGPKTRGDIYLVNQTVLKSDRYSAHPNAIDGGRLFKDRLLYATHDVVGKSFASITNADGSASADASIASGATVTLADVEAALPGITYAND